MSRLPAAPSPAKPAVPRSVLLADAKVTIRAPIPRVFEALLDPAQLVQRWADEPRVEPESGGRYRGSLTDQRGEAPIQATRTPGTRTVTRPGAHDAGPAK